MTGHPILAWPSQGPSHHGRPVERMCSPLSLSLLHFPPTTVRFCYASFCLSGPFVLLSLVSGRQHFVPLHLVCLIISQPPFRPLHCLCLSLLERGLLKVLYHLLLLVDVLLPLLAIPELLLKYVCIFLVGQHARLLECCLLDSHPLTLPYP